jgi:RNA polymerase sigma-70 factor (ECF subfamily)
LPRQTLQSYDVSDDLQLIDQAIDGQPEAFGQLVLKYQDRLYNTVYHVLGHAEDARDVVQEAMVQAFVKLDTFGRRSAFYTWLYRIAFNVAASHRRRQKPSASLARVPGKKDFDPPDNELDPVERLEQKQRCQRVRQAIAQLHEDYRSVLVLREIDGCRYETISEILDLPLGTVRSRLHRARLQLRDALKDMLAEEVASCESRVESRELRVES